MIKKLVWISTFFLWYSLTLVGTLLLWFMPYSRGIGFVAGDGPNYSWTWGILEYAETGYFYLPEPTFSCFWTRPDTIRIFPWPFVITLLVTVGLWSGTIIWRRRLIARGYLTTKGLNRPERSGASTQSVVEPARNG